MITNFDYSMRNLLVDEGGYVNDPNDAGGETKYGISKRAYPNEDIKNLTEARAKEIYRKDYWNKFGGDAIISPEKASAIFSTCVNFGVYGGIKIVQKAIDDITCDGIVGSHTIRRVNDMDPDKFLALLSLSMLSKYASICRKNRSQIKFLLGWVNRALRISGMEV